MCAPCRVAKQAGLARHAQQVHTAYVSHLRAAGQHARLAQLAQDEGRLDEALDLWLQAGKPVEACQVTP